MKLFQNKIRFFTIGLFFSVSSICNAQSDFIKRFYPENDLSNHFVYSQWSTKDGLPQNSINSIVQTTDGYLWLATQGGVVRFDGSRFTGFDLNKYPELGTNRISKLGTDSIGGLWILGEGGQLSYYNKGHFTNYSKQLYALLGEDAYKLRKILVENPKSIWLGTLSNIIHFDGNSFTKETNNNIEILYDYSFFIDKKRNIYALSDFGIYSRTTSGFKKIKLFSGLDVNDISPGPGNSLYIGSVKGLLRTDLNLKKKILPPSEMQYPITVLEYDELNDELWFSQPQKGLWRLKNDEVRKLELPIFENLEIQDIFIDKQGNLWIGTNISGLFRLDKKILYSISLRNGKFNDVIYPIMKAEDNSIWIGSNCGGIVRITGSDKYYYSSPSELLSNCVWSLYQNSSGDIYIGSLNEGIQKYSGNKFIRIPGLNPLSKQSVFAIKEDMQKALWIGTDAGLYQFKNNILKHFSKNNSQLPGDRISAIVEDNKGTLWFATDEGLGFYENESIGYVNLGNGKSRSYIRSIYIDKDQRMWLGTYGSGLIYYFNGKSKIITTEDGLFNNYIHSTIEDKFGNFWMPTNNGLFRVQKDELIDLVDGRIDLINSVVVTEQNTIANDEFNGGMQPAYAELDDGTILLPTLEGLAALDLTNFHLHNSIPQVHIENFIIDGVDHSIHSPLIIPPGYSEIQINFAALDFSNPDNIRFKYKIEGLDKDWSSLKKERYVTYKHLAYGKYRFRVIARNADGVWNKEGSYIDFEIEATLFQTLWFKFLVVFLLIFLIIGYFSLRLKLQRKRAQQLEKIVKERTKSLSEALEKTKKAKENEAVHRERAEKLNNEKTELLRIVSHNLKNPIGVILSSSEFIAEDVNDEESVIEMIKIIRSSAAHMLESISQLLQSSQIEDPGVKLNFDEFNFIDAVKKIINDNKIPALKKKQKILFNPSSDKIIVKADYEKISICIDNYINNAIKYSYEDTEIVVEVLNVNSGVLFRVIDRGPGIKEAELKMAFGKFQRLSSRPTGNENSTGLGLSIVKRIIELHNGEIGVESVYGKGSTFYFTLPFDCSV